MYRGNMRKIITDDVQTNIFEGINVIGIYTETFLQKQLIELILICEDNTVTVTCKTVIKALIRYFNFCLKSKIG